MDKEKVVFAWSGGKDSAFALHQVFKAGKYDVKYLLTTLNKEFKRVSMHGVKEELLDLQAESIGIPLLKVWVSENSFEDYENQMEQMMNKVKSEGVESVIFGDIFLDDLREYREKNMQKVKMGTVFPLWKRDTKELIKDFLSDGFQTITCCVNDANFKEDSVGRLLDEHFIADLPINVDPCGENGEFHTFCFDGPIFKNKISFKKGERIYKPLEEKYIEDKPNSTKGFWFIELDSIDR
jgi:uncharacterized protein (TIGR00290 family)